VHGCSLLLELDELLELGGLLLEFDELLEFGGLLLELDKLLALGKLLLELDGAPGIDELLSAEELLLDGFDEVLLVPDNEDDEGTLLLDDSIDELLGGVSRRLELLPGGT
jgi:hypothetical protein